jgi:hypothetical protein
MSKNVTEHTTGAGEILFMAAAKALNNKKTGKTEFSIKLKLPATDPCISHLTSVANYKVDTKTNRAMQDSGNMVINFSSNFAPTVVDADNSALEGSSVPFFDGRKDKGTAAVTYKVIDYGDNQIVRLSGIKLLSLDLAPRDESSNSIDVTLETLKNIG